MLELQARSHEWALTLCLTKGMEDPGLKILTGPKGRCKVWADHGNSRDIKSKSQRALAILTFAALSTSETARWSAAASFLEVSLKEKIPRLHRTVVASAALDRYKFLSPHKGPVTHPRSWVGKLVWGRPAACTRASWAGQQHGLPHLI